MAHFDSRFLKHEALLQTGRCQHGFYGGAVRTRVIVVLHSRRKAMPLSSWILGLS